MKYYINFKYENYDIETIEETNSYKDAKYLLQEYQMNGGNYWISKRATKEYYKN